MPAKTASARVTLPFDANSSAVGIDNQCSACITHVQSDLPGEISPQQKSIKGFGGTQVWDVWKGTIKWAIEDDYGETHHFVIPNSYYIPQAGV